MTQLLPKWIMKRYLLLWEKFKVKRFTFEQALEVVGDSRSILSLVMSYLKKAGWIKMELDPKDARKRLYTLTPYDKIFKEVIQDIHINQGNKRHYNG
jgi:hypothetical protein